MTFAATCRAVALLLGAAPVAALAAGCPQPVPGMALPAEAQPLQLPDPVWRGHVADLDRKIAASDLGSVKALFVGDSITEGWAPLVFQNFYGDRAPLDIGVRGDTIQGVLWRLGRLPLGTILRPKLVVLLIGTNDLWSGANPDHIGLGIAETVRLIRSRSPASTVLLLGLLPRGAEPSDPMRPLVTKVNAAIAGCADGKHVVFANPGTMLPDGQGKLSNQITFDYLHPTWIGYAILAAAIEPDIRRILADR